MKKVAIIVVWFGKLPVFFPLWVRSISANKNYQFFLFTDQHVENKNLPENLTVISITMDEFKELVFKKLSISVTFSHAYKLCDFKPVYGEIFDDYISEFDFWGNCDLDMLFGNLNAFFTDELLMKHTKLMVHGFFVLYKNEKELRAMYRKSKTLDYVKILQADDVCYGFDEWHGINHIYNEYGIDAYHNKEIFAEVCTGSARLSCSNIQNYPRQIFVWSKGSVKQYYIVDNTVHSKEVAYIHYQKRVMKINDPGVYTSSSIIINSLGFFPHEGDITAETIRKYDKPNYKHVFKRQYNKRIKPLISKSNKPDIHPVSYVAYDNPGKRIRISLRGIERY